jgi:hypothetical protein
MTTSVFASERTAQFTTFHVEIELVDRIVGGQPKDPRLVEGWLSKNMGLEDEELRAQVLRHLHEMGVEVPADASYEDLRKALDSTAEEIKTQGFKRDAEGRPYIEARHLKAMVKESANIVYPPGIHKFGSYTSKSKENTGKTVGGKAAKDFIAERVFVEPGQVTLADEISGVDLAIGHIKDFKAEGGKRATIGYFEYVEGASFGFEVLAHDNCLTDEQWARIWTHAELNGIGAMRSQGYGQFRVTKWDRH